MKCLVDPWVVHLHTMVLANTVGVIQTVVFGAELEIHYILNSAIHMLQTLNLIKIQSSKEERAMVPSSSYATLVITWWRCYMITLA